VAVRKGTRTRKTAKSSSSSAGRTKGKKSSRKSAKSPIPWAVLFWLVFAIVIFGLYIFHREAIDNSVQIVVNAFSSRGASDERTPEVKEKEPAAKEPAAKEPPVTAPAIAPSEAKQPSASQQATKPPVSQATEPVRPSASTQNSEQNVPSTTQSPAGQNPPVQRPPETRERVLYFVQVDRSGYISRVQANRRLPVSDSPLTDVVQALIAGPNADEKSKGLISLIPPATKLLSASIRGNTAYLSFNEEFQYNTYGVEGYAGQVRQIVFTVTEFSNVADVQILIEGRRIDYLGEGVWVGSPVSRDML
jgi:germination protein M